MTPEERFQRIEGQLELLATQQGQFYTDLRRLAGQIETQQGQIGQVVTVVGRMGEILQEVLRAQERTENHLAETDQRLRETDRRLRETDQRLNILIGVVERHISGNGQGSSQSGPGL